MHKLLIPILIAPLWLFIPKQASAANVTSSTTGVFNCASGTGLTGCGTNTIVISGIVQISFVGAAPTTVVLNPPPFTLSSFGTVVASCVGGGTACNTVPIPVGISLTITLSQTAPFAASTSAVDGVLTGSLSGTLSTAQITWPVPNSFAFTSPGLATVTYSFPTNPVALAPPNTSGGVSGIPSRIDYLDLSLTMNANPGTTPQSTPVNTTFPVPLAVTVRNAFGSPVQGVDVTFTFSDTSASGVFPNGSGVITVTTTAAGVAATLYTANATQGPHQVTASAPGLTDVIFSLTNLPPLPLSLAFINPPSVTQTTPSSFQITLNGSGFLTFPSFCLQAVFQGGTNPSYPLTVLSDSLATVTVPYDDAPFFAGAAYNIAINVLNFPSSGCPITPPTASRLFTYRLLPSITSLNPAAVLSGSANVNLITNGTNFLSRCQARRVIFDTTVIRTIVSSSLAPVPNLTDTFVLATIPASLLANPRATTVTVETGDNSPGGTFVCGTASAPFNVVLSSGITTTALTDALVNFAYSFQLQGQFNCAGNLCAQFVSWGATGLPTGLTLNPQTGVISGTPAQPGDFTVNVTLTDSLGRISTAALPLRVSGLRIFSPTTLPTGRVNQPFSMFIVAVNGTPPLTFSVSAGSLPQGLTLNPGTGLLSGTPVIGGIFPITLRATDSLGTTDSRQYVLTIIGGPLSITTTSLASGTVNQPYSQPVVASGGTPAYTWTASNLPPGLSINPTTGIINGTPTQAGTFAATITVRDSADGPASASANLQLIVSASIDPLRILTTTLPPGAVAQPYSTQLSGSGGTTPFNWTATGLPSGITLDAGTGILSGTTQSAGDFTVTITLTDPGQRTASAILTLTISTSAITITTLALPDGTVGVASSFQLNATGGQTPYTFTVTAGALPAGLQLGSSGLLSGTPAQTGTFTVTVTVTGPNSTPASRTYTFNISSTTLTITTASLSAVLNQFFQQVLTGTGGLAPFVWSATGLPAGFTLDPNTGLLSGFASTAGSTTISITLRDALNNTTTRTIPFTVTGDVLRIVTDTLIAATANVFYLQQVIAAGGTPPYLFSAASLPAGFSISSAGVISGNSPVTGTFSITVTVSDAAGQSVTRPYTLAVVPPQTLPLSLTNPNLPPGTVGSPYSQGIPVQGGTQPYRFGINTGSVPGLTLSAGGILSGTPSLPGTYPITIVVTDNNGTTVVLTVTLVINPTPLTITAPTIPPAVVGSSVSVQLQVSGGVSPIVFGATTTIPPGLNLSAAGVISGTPTQPGTFTVGVRVTDNTGQTSQSSITIVVISPIQSASTLPAATVGDAFTFPLNITGGLPPFSFRLISGPDGISLSANGTFTGIPTQAGSFPVTVQVTDAGAQQTTLSLTLTVVPGLRFTGGTIPSAIAGTQFSFNLPIAGGEAPFTFSATGLPQGLTISPDGIISGVTTQIGPFNLSVTVRDGQGRIATQAFSFTVQAAPLRFTSPSQLPDGTAGSAYSQSLAAIGGQPPFTFSVASGALPTGLSLNPATGAITGTPLAGGTFNITIQLQDSSGTSASTGITIRIGLPALGRPTITGVPAAVQPLSQPTPALSLPAAYPLLVNGVLTLTFLPSNTQDDPGIVFSNGLRTVNFTIPANQTAAQFPSGFGFAVGTNAGTIRLTASFSAGGSDITPAPAPSQDTTVAAAVPVISSVDVTRSGNALSVVIVGFSTTREVSSARFSFTPVAGQSVQTTDFTVAVTPVFTTWYQSADSRQFGSQFKLTIPFNIQGNATAVNALSVSLTNSVGASQPASKTF